MATDNGHYIEVLSEAEYTEEITNHILDLIVEVRATQDHIALAEVNALKERTIQHLMATGLPPTSILDGGTRLTRPWYQKKNVGKKASVKLIIQIADLDQLARSLSDIEQIRQSQRETIQFHMRQPVFQADDTAVNRALQQAIIQAKQKATILATEAGVQLGNIARIEELSRTKRDSGAYGDEDWWGDSQRFATGAAGAGVLGAEDSSLPNLDTPKRTIWVRYKVRFLIQ